MHDRQNVLTQWLKTILDDMPFILTPLAGDASFRRYFRLHHDKKSYVVMDAPPSKEDVVPFININEALANIGVHTPKIQAVNASQGFILLEDLGDHLLLNALSPDDADRFYQAAMSTLITMQQCSTAQLPLFDKAHMLQELSLFRQWFLHHYLALKLSPKDDQCLQESFNWLTNEISIQPQVFIHRDYHSRNLMVIGEHAVPELGVIDFQDAMRGPFTYDLVSLLKDCYIQWPREQISTWVNHFFLHLPDTHGWSQPAFSRGFDLCGLQRHLKVLGIFCRLSLRDNKPSFLRDLPLTFNYVMAGLESYDELKPLYHFMQHKVQLPFIETIKQ